MGSLPPLVQEAEHQKEKGSSRQAEKEEGVHSVPTRADAQEGRHLDVNWRVLPLRAGQGADKSTKETRLESVEEVGED